MPWNGGWRIKEARRRANITIDELARKTNVSRRTIINYENNSQEPQINFLLTTAKICNVDFLWLSTGSLEDNFVREPGTNYLTTDTELTLLKKLFEIPEARPLIYKYIAENIRGSELAKELDKLLEQKLNNKKEE